MVESDDQLPQVRRPAEVHLVYPLLGERRFSAVVLGTLLLRKWRLMVGVPVMLSVAAATFILIRGARYTTQSRFKPQTTQASGSRFSGLAAQFGISLGDLSGGESIDFYAALVKSPTVLKDVALTSYHLPGDGSGQDTLSGTIFDLYRVRDADPQRRMQKAVDLLSGQITVGTDAKTGLVTVQTRTRWRGLAEALNRRLLDLVNDFNLRKRQSQAAAERGFVEARMEQARGDLEAAENELDLFLEQNRVSDSPRLRSQQARIQRRVDLRQQVFVTLAQAYEQARIEEVRNTPVITIVDPPEGNTRRSRGLAVTTLGAFVFGLGISVAAVLAGDYMTRRRAEHPDEFGEFEAARQSLLQALSLKRGRHDRVDR